MLCPSETCDTFLWKQDLHGQTPLCLASCNNHIRVVEALLVGVEAAILRFRLVRSVAV